MSEVRVSRGSLCVTTLLMLPAFLVGEWAASRCGFRPFSLHDVGEGFWGAGTLCVVLLFTRGEQCRT
jgi:hypothetical protein